MLRAAVLLVPALPAAPGHPAAAPLHQTQLRRPVRHPRQGQGGRGGAGRGGPALLHRVQELHCCVGPAYTQLLWYKDGEVFPWAREEGRARSAVLYRCHPPLATLCNAACCSNNQSLVMLEVGAEDAGRFRCEAVSAAGRRLGHTTRLRTFPPPVFAHPPIWNTQPEDVRVGAADNILTRGGNEPSRSLKFFNHREDPT